MKCKHCKREIAYDADKDQWREEVGVLPRYCWVDQQQGSQLHVPEFTQKEIWLYAMLGAQELARIYISTIYRAEELSLVDVYQYNGCSRQIALERVLPRGITFHYRLQDEAATSVTLVIDEEHG